METYDISSDHAPFKDRNKFQDDVWGEIKLNQVECEVVNTPEFQRLFRTSQLGFVDFVYHSANHTRGTHSIGACKASEVLIAHLMENTRQGRSDPRYAQIDLSEAERVLIRLGALLHDISHVPLSHDLERKSHRIYLRSDDKQEPVRMPSSYGYFDKHDDYENNPLLYILLCDTNRSVLARVLRHYSKAFYKLLLSAKNKNEHEHLAELFTCLGKAEKEGWKVQDEILPALLFHLLVCENPKVDSKRDKLQIAVDFDGDGKPIVTSWGIGPPALWNEFHDTWYQPFRHDIIGNTLSADLMDYLKRDPQRLGSDRRIDLHLLNYYVLVDDKLGKNSDVPSESEHTANQPSVVRKRYRCAIDLHDRKRGTPRVNLIDDIFRLLDLRQEIHQKAVMHRVVQSANAMLSRALLLLAGC